MSGIKKDREVLKKRFLKGMYPTEDDFADVFESYVHKDDEIINNKADKTALENFAKEIEGVLEVVRNEDGTVNKTVIQDLTKRIEDAEEDLADAANNAEKNGDAVAKILTILGKQDGETVSELAAKFTALSGSYATVYAFVSKVKAFLESADASDETINRWQEIESFLQGITDKETLTGLLESLKTEIMQSVPKGNFLEQVADLDSYDNAPEGKIVQYIGQTNEQYERGHFYERKGDVQIIPPNTLYIKNISDIQSGGDTEYIATLLQYPFVLTNKKEKNFKNYNNGDNLYMTEPPTVGARVTHGSGDVDYITAINGDTIKLQSLWTAKLSEFTEEEFEVYENSKGVRMTINYNTNINFSGEKRYTGDFLFFDSDSLFAGYATFILEKNVESITYGSNSWQHIPVSPVVY